MSDGLADALKNKAQLAAMKARLDQYDTFEGKPAGGCERTSFLAEA